MALMVKKYQSSWVPLYTIAEGDWIMGENRWTQVIGVCNRRVNGGIGEKGNRITDGVWLKGDSMWHHPTDLLDKSSWQGINLITDSGTFIIKRTNSKEYTVRDFTEVGWMNLPETYARVEIAMEPNKKDGF